MSKMNYKGLVGRVDGSDQTYKVTQDHQGWLMLEDKDGHELEAKVRKGNFTPSEDQEADAFDEGGEVFIDEDTGKVVDAEGNEIDSDEEEPEDEEAEDEEGKESKPMYALQRRKAEGAYETIKLEDGRTSLVSKQHRQTELDDFAGDPDGAMAYVEKTVGLDEGTLAKRYLGLNPGQKRMNAGNILRSFRLKQNMICAVGDELGMTEEQVKGVWARLGKNPTEKKLRALINADKAEAEKAAAGPEVDGEAENAELENAGAEAEAVEATDSAA